MRDSEFVGYFLLGELSFGLFDDLGNKFGPLNGRFALAPADVEAFVGVALEREAEKVSFLADPDGCDLGFGVAVGGVSMFERFDIPDAFSAA